MRVITRITISCDKVVSAIPLVLKTQICVSDTCVLVVISRSLSLTVAFVRSSHRCTLLRAWPTANSFNDDPTGASILRIFHSPSIVLEDPGAQFSNPIPWYIKFSPQNLYTKACTITANSDSAKRCMRKRIWGRRLLLTYRGCILL